MASRSRSCRAAEAGGEIAAMVGGVDSVHHAATSVVPVKSGSPSRARVSINVVRLTPKFAADGRLGHATVQSSKNGVQFLARNGRRPPAALAVNRLLVSDREESKR
jgi:hypothetical protein